MEISSHSSSLCRNFAFGSSPFPKQRLVNEPKMKIDRLLNSDYYKIVDSKERKRRILFSKNSFISGNTKGFAQGKENVNS